MEPDAARDRLLRTWIDACRDRPLDTFDDRYVDLDAQGVRGHQDRKLFLQDTIELAGDGPTCQLFSGFRGTGKSTELARLKLRLEQAGYTVLLADAQQFHTLTRDLRIEELLPVIAGAFGAAAGEILGEDGLLDAGWWERFIAFCGKDVALEPTLKLGPAQVKAALRGDDAFLVQMNKTLAGRLDVLAGQVRAFVSEVVAHLRRRAPGNLGVVFLFDNLEKLSGPEHRFRERMESVLSVFADHHGYLRLPDCHTVYTVPLYLEALYPALSEHYDAPLQVLPTIALTAHDVQRTPLPSGADAMREVLAERVPVDQAFGSEEQLHRVLLASGGHLRGLLEMVSTLLVRARRTGLPFTDDLVNSVISGFSDKRRQAVRIDGVPLLDGIRRSFSLDTMSDDDLPRLAHYLESNLVLCYRNGGGWYDLHPAIRPHVERLAASLAANLAASQGPSGGRPAGEAPHA